MSRFLTWGFIVILCGTCAFSQAAVGYETSLEYHATGDGFLFFPGTSDGWWTFVLARGLMAFVVLLGGAMWLLCPRDDG